MLSASDPAPDFLLQAVDDPDAEYMLSAAANAGPVVLAFVPDDASAAGTMLTALADLDWATLADRISVFAIGSDPRALRSFAADLPFPVLYDHDTYVSDLYGVAERGTSIGTRRALALVDETCTIRFSCEQANGRNRLPLDDLAVAIRSL